jgi:hypothetical protein
MDYATIKSTRKLGATVSLADLNVALEAERKNLADAAFSVALASADLKLGTTAADSPFPLEEQNAILVESFKVATHNLADKLRHVSKILAWVKVAGKGEETAE